MGGVCSVLCRRRDSPPGSWKAMKPVVGCVGGWGGDSFTVFVLVSGRVLRLAGCGVRVSACCTCWCAGLWCVWGVCACVV